MGLALLMIALGLSTIAGRLIFKLSAALIRFISSPPPKQS
jgi:hypothetical protein